MGLSAIFFFGVFFATGWFFGYQKGLSKVATGRTRTERPTAIEDFSEADIADLGEIMKTIFWKFTLERKERRFLVSDPKTGRRLAFVSISRKLSRKSKNTIDGVMVVTYPDMPSESEIRSDLSSLFW